jgi:hypothetical protein
MYHVESTIFIVVTRKNIVFGDVMPIFERCILFLSSGSKSKPIKVGRQCGLRLESLIQI